MPTIGDPDQFHYLCGYPRFSPERYFNLFNLMPTGYSLT